MTDRRTDRAAATHAAKKKPHRVPLLRRQEARQLATDVATKGWKHIPRSAGYVEHWEKDVPDGHLHVIEGEGVTGRYFDLQHVSDSGVVTKLGTTRGSLERAKVAAVLNAMHSGHPVVNPQAVRNLAPARSRWIDGAIKHPGKLSKLAARMGLDDKPFMRRSFAEQKKILDACVGEYGYRSCLGSAMLMANLPAIRDDPRKSARAVALKDYLVKKYGGPGSFSPRRNPPDGSWDAIPVIFVHLDLGNVRLTSRQVTELQLETS